MTQKMNKKKLLLTKENLIEIILFPLGSELRESFNTNKSWSSPFRYHPEWHFWEAIKLKFLFVKIAWWKLAKQFMNKL